MDSHFSVGWAVVGLSVQRLHGGQPLFQGRITASLNEDDDFAGLIGRFEFRFSSLQVVRKDVERPSKSEGSVTHSPTRPSSRGEVERVYFASHGAAEIEFDGDSQVRLWLVSTVPEFVDEVMEWFSSNTSESIPKGRVHVMVSTATGPEFRSLGVGGQKLERGNYSKAVLDGYDRIVQDLQADLPAGRVAILDGKPGTGKTFLVRGLLDEISDVIFVVVPANLIQELAQPGMIPALVDLHQSRGGKPMVFIIEDADEVLAPRAGDNMSSVSSILNLGDGILGQLLDIRIVATTNAHRQDVDEAIKRPGRLSAMVHVGPLSAVEAAVVYTRLTGKPPIIPGDPLSLYTDSPRSPVDRPMFTGPTSLAEVYQMARDRGWTPAPESRKKMGFSVDD